MTPEEKEDHLGEMYGFYLAQQDDDYLINRLISEICTQPLEDNEVKSIIKMIQDRNYTGKDDPGFEDIRSSL